MATIKLGQRPKNFKRTVEVPMHDGTKGTVECVFKYRTVVEYGEFIDRLNTSAGYKPADGSDFSLKDFMSNTRDKNGAYLLEVLEGWNLDSDLTLVTAQQLCDEYPGACNAVIEAYRVATVEGRLGN